MTAVPACVVCGGQTFAVSLRGATDRLVPSPERFEVLTCGTCGLGATSPQPSPEELSRRYPEASYACYREEPAPRSAADPLRLRAFRRGWDSRLGRFRALLRRDPGTLLEVGCGAGAVGATFVNRGWEVTGVEPSTAAAKVAEQRGLRVCRGTLDEVELPSSGFDAILFSHSLEHIPDPSEALSASYSALNPGGVLLIAVPNYSCWPRKLFRSNWLGLDVPRHLYHFTAASLVRCAEDNGFAVDSLRTCSTSYCIPGTIQYALFGRWKLPQTGMIGLALGWLFKATLLLWPSDELVLFAERP